MNTNYVPPEGPSDARVAIIGEAPGYHEDRLQKPFVGRSGVLLRRTLTDIGLPPEEIWLTNVIKHRPPDNATPTAAEISAALPVLVEELQALPNLEWLLLLGNSALKAITGKTGITTKRGRVKGVRKGLEGLASVDLFATLHPAVVLRNPNYHNGWVQDLVAFRLTLDASPEAPSEEVIVVDRDSALDLLEEFSWENHGALDVETTMEGALVSVAVCGQSDKAYVVNCHDDPDDIARDTLFALSTSPTQWIMHNGAFDRKVLLRYGYDFPVHHDTMAMQYLINENERKGLDVLTPRYLGKPSYKDVDYNNILEEPFEKVALMNGRDAINTRALFFVLAKLLDKEPSANRLYQKLIMPSVRALIELTEIGVPLDLDRVAQLKEELLADKAHLLDSFDLNPASPKQLGEYLFGELGLSPVMFTEKGAPSTSEAALIDLRASNPDTQEFIDRVLEFRSINKSLGYIDGPKGWLANTDDKGWVHPRYKPLHVVTGRLSSENPNIQNVPRHNRFRRVFGGVEDYLWLKADYSQIELRIAAWLSGETTMLQAYKDGADLHTVTAELVLGTKDARQVGKTLNFGLLYGAGWRKLQQIASQEYGIGLSDREARTYRDGFFNTYPRLADFHKSTERILRIDGYVTSPIGRVRHLPEIHSGDEGKEHHAIRQAINHPVQSFASDITVLSLVSLVEDPLPGVIPICVVHDEINFLVHKDFVSQAADKVKERMTNPPLKKKFGIELPFPLVVDTGIGTHWSNE